jgi:hypothetical protein
MAVIVEFLEAAHPLALSCLTLEEFDLLLG